MPYILTARVIFTTKRRLEESSLSREQVWTFSVLGDWGGRLGRETGEGDWGVGSGTNG